MVSALQDSGVWIMTPEGLVKEKIKRILKRYKVHYAMPRGTSYGRQGVADFVCCTHGRYLAVEAKATKYSRQTAMQKYEMEQVRLAGGVYLLIHEDNLHELEAYLKEIREDAENKRQSNSV